MKGKIFTTDEANRMLPLVTRIADDLVAAYADLTTALRALEEAKAREGEGPGAAETVRQRDAEVDESLRRLQALVEEIEALGGSVKDYEHGGIDFYGDLDGEIVYLCWCRGEPRIGHWHRLEEGYAMRRHLPAASAAA
jgi:hypothetical protein